MGFLKDVLGVGSAVKEVVEVFVPNKSENAEYEHLEHSAALNQFSAEFKRSRGNKFNNFIDGLNRLPRPTLALGTVALFGYAMFNPEHFSQRMSGLDTIPRELWWLLGAIVSFYFGARELHYVRKTKPAKPNKPSLKMLSETNLFETDNQAIADWKKSLKKP